MEDDSLDSEVRDVYAHFGLAIYLAQCLEHGLVNAFVFIELIPNRLSLASTREQWESVVESFTESKFRLTLGRMIGNLERVTPVDSNLADRLAKALEKRNWLAHHYFKDRAATFLTSKGRAEMIQELEEAQRLFQDADLALDNAIEPARLSAGLTDEELAKAYDELRNQID